MRKLHRSRELQLTSVIGTRPLMGSIHASRIARTRAARSHCGGRSVGRWVGRSSDSSTPLRFVVYRRRKWGDGRWEIGEICRHVGSAHRSRVSLLLGRGGCYAAVTQAANVFHLIRFDLLNCINRARPGCFSPLLSFRAFISSRARTGGVRNSDCFKINTSSTQHRYLTETWPHSVNHQFYNSSCLRAFPLYFIYIFATVRNPTLSLCRFFERQRKRDRVQLLALIDFSSLVVSVSHGVSGRGGGVETLG